MAATTLNRDILKLAVPALGALVAEPLFLIVDSALVGHLGVTPLAGLGIASAVLQTIVGLMVFLAYATTPAVARRFGAGDHANAEARGVLVRPDGVLALTGSILALTVNKNFALIPAFLGAGLTLAGSTGWCGLAILLSKMPWNRVEGGGCSVTTCSF